LVVLASECGVDVVLEEHHALPEQHLFHLKTRQKFT
jgi:hypothetical protein